MLDWAVWMSTASFFTGVERELAPSLDMPPYRGICPWRAPGLATERGGGGGGAESEREKMNPPRP